jgi:hypothetical protein
MAILPAGFAGGFYECRGSLVLECGDEALVLECGDEARGKIAGLGECAPRRITALEFRGAVAGESRVSMTGTRCRNCNEVEVFRISKR